MLQEATLEEMIRTVFGRILSKVSTSVVRWGMCVCAMVLRWNVATSGVVICHHAI